MRPFHLACSAVFVVMFVTTAQSLGQSSSPSPAATCAEPNRAAQAINAVVPDYPDAAAELHLKEKRAVVVVKTDATGAVIATWIAVSTGNEDLDNASLAAARRSTFRPAVANCVPVASAFAVNEVFSPLVSDSVEVARTPAAAVAPSPSFSAPPGWVAYTGRASEGWQLFSSWRSGRSAIRVEGSAAVGTIDDFHAQVEQTLLTRGASIVRDRAVLICNDKQPGWLFEYTLQSGSLGYIEIAAFQGDAEYLVTYGSYDHVHPSADVIASLTSLCMPALPPEPTPT